MTQDKMQAPRGEQLIGTLRRKKEKHNKFEDAWKQKVLCCLEGSLLSMKTMNGSKLQSEERLDITQWIVEATATGNPSERSKFFLTREQQQIKLKADSIAEADLWVRNLKTASRRGLEQFSNQVSKESSALSFKYPSSTSFDSSPARPVPEQPSPYSQANIQTIYRTNSGSVVTKQNSEYNPPHPANPQMNFSFSGAIPGSGGTSESSSPPLAVLPMMLRIVLCSAQNFTRSTAARRRQRPALTGLRHPSPPAVRRRRRRAHAAGHRPLLSSAGRREPAAAAGHPARRLVSVRRARTPRGRPGLGSGLGFPWRPSTAAARPQHASHRLSPRKALSLVACDVSL